MIQLTTMGSPKLSGCDCFTSTLVSSCCGCREFFPPVPSEVIMPLAGYLATQGKLALGGIIIAGTVGSVAGALPLY